MNKFSIYGLSAIVALGFVACDDYEEPNPAPQTNPQESAIQTDAVKFTNAIQSGAYSLESLNDAGSVISLGSVQAELPAGYEIGVKAQVAHGGDYVDLPATVTANTDTLTGVTTYNVAVSPDVLQGIIVGNFTKNPAQQQLSVRYNLLAMANGSQQAVIGGPENFYGPFDLNVVPMTPAMVIEESYYLVGSFCNWDVNEAIKFNHSATNQYDDPMFSLAITTTEDNAEWKVIPASTFAAGQMLTSDYAQWGGSEEENGDLTPSLDGVEATPGSFGAANSYVMSIDMESHTYTINVGVMQLYTPGNSNGWDQLASQMLTTGDYLNFTGYAHLNGEFKFSTQPNWNGTNYGSTGVEGVLTTDGGAGNLNAPVDALYWCDVHIGELTYTITQIESYGLIGGFNDWGSQANLTPSDDFLTWTGEFDLPAGELKFRANNNWDINLGGDLENLTAGGDNINITEAGTYFVTLDFSAVPYTATFEKR